ncbi:hypothetical protein GOB07_30875 [Sinorhizobium meliloti]|uniref:hypothetical protein n=1 Tax=Rhizobium meliloti TaxID=382 RepID=UPI000B497B7F|nr:hypothetical protein [Sinorhizobium meliloti]ASQ12666.1 hypothetical protein CDO22_21515 [Sinorhizobium meliloti]MDW9401411.1 hypothetical protein [Sinorhizobium meliloti]MDW9540363.1 hypothetical protein [Sinorhizobium meliloti]MDW9615343.1 hypothetical protein [Sinorhizobium meliloti]MDW9838053.1 hypothetical protein [Sinorhizobium meliloti]
MGGLGQTEAIHDRRVVYEPTDPYHRAFKRRLNVAGAALVKVVYPRRARHFAEATGKVQHLSTSSMISYSDHRTLDLPELLMSCRLRTAKIRFFAFSTRLGLPFVSVASVYASTFWRPSLR